MIIGFLILVGLIVKIGYLQFVKGSWLKEQAISNQLSSRTIEASRGTIYDANGKALAKSASVDNIIINPTNVKYRNGDEVNKEILAHAFSDIFGLDYAKILEDLNTKTKSYTIVSKIENDKVEMLQSWMKDNKIYSGIRIEDDIKRFYPYNNLASNLIGFTGTENTGRMGLEYTLDDILSRNARKNTIIYRFYKWRNPK